MKIFDELSISMLIFIFLFILFRPINALASATLTLQNVVVNDNGGTATATNWTLDAYVGRRLVLSGLMGSVTVTNATVDADTYFLSETGGILNYTVSDWSCTNGIVPSYNYITLSNGQSTVCTVTLDDRPPILSLRNVVINDNGGTATASDWMLSATGTISSPSNLSGSASVDSGANFKADTYLLHASGPANYTDTSWECEPQPDPDSSITLQLGEYVICTITHDDVIAPRLTVTEIVVGGTKTISDFLLFVDGSGVTSGNQNISSIGLHTISITQISSYTSVINGDCASNGTITLAPGDVKNCTITNTYTPASLVNGSGPLIVWLSGAVDAVIKTEPVSSALPISPVVVPAPTSIPVVSAVIPIPKWPKTGFPSTFFKGFNNFLILGV